MFILLVRKELLEQLLSLRFAMACVLCLVIMLSSTFVLTKDYKEALADYRTNVVMHENQIEASNDLVWDGIKVDKPLNPLQIFVRGVSRELTATAKINGPTEPQFEANFEGNPVVFLFPTIDLFYFVGVVMSLLAIAFSYDAVSGEKELGTLKVLMSYSVPRDLVLLAKWLGGYLALVTPFLLSFLSGLVVVILFPTVELRPPHWQALGLILACSLLYLGAIYSVGIFASARTHLASTSITVLLMVWVLIVFVAPNVAPYIGTLAHPMRDFVTVDKEKRQLEREEEEKFEAEWKEWEENNPDAEDNIRWSTWPTLKRKQLVAMSGSQDKINDNFLKQMDTQIGLAQYLSRVSPLSSFAFAACDLAGSGVRDRNRFQQLLPDYRREITQFGFETRINAARNDSWDERTIEGYPRLAYEESRLSDRLATVYPDILLLGVWNVIFFMGAYLSFLRYDVK